MRLTLILILICVVVFMYQVIFVSDPSAFFDSYGFSGKNLVERPYVFVTSIFLHADIIHLVSNMFVLFFFGIALEDEIGKKMLTIFFLGAFLVL